MKTIFIVVTLFLYGCAMERVPVDGDLKETIEHEQRIEKIKSEASGN